MERATVTSTALASIGYDSEQQILQIEFKDGDVYNYYEVPAWVFQGLMNAGSHGTYFDTTVKQNGYRYEKVETGGK